MEKLKTVINKKGNAGWIVGFYNISQWGDWEYSKDHTLTMYTEHIEICSCGKKQMTAFITGKGMAKAFFGPECEVYETLEDAEKACKEMLVGYTNDSIALTQEKLVTNEENYSAPKYKWWPARKLEMQNFLKELQDGSLVQKVINR